MDFNKDLNQLKKLKKQCLIERNRINDQEQDELAKLDEKKNQIIEEYSKLKREKYEEMDICDDKIDSYCQIISDYSIFNVRDIGNVIASLIRTFEGINYIYTVEGFINKIVVIDNYLNTNEKELVLSSTETEKIKFYKVNKNRHVLESCINYKGFNYVQKFIDELISYKMEKKSKDISKEELEKLKINFIASRIEQIKENYRIVEKEREEQMKEKLESEKEGRQLRLNRILKKMGNL